MAELFDIVTSDTNSLPAEVADVSELPSDDLDTIGADQAQARVTGTAAAGQYMVTLSSTASIDSTSNAVFGRFTINPANPNAVLAGEWETGSRVAANSGDNLFFTYAFPMNHGGGAYDIAFQLYKQASNNTLIAKFVNVVFNRIS